MNLELSKFNPEKQSYGLKKILIYSNVSLILCSLLFLFWQFYFISSLASENTSIQSSRAYKEVIKELDDFVILYDFKLLNSNSIQQQNSSLLNYNIFSVSELINTCLEEEGSIYKLSFLKFCKESLPVNQTVEINYFNDRSYLYYQSFPKKNFYYYFKNISQDCNSGDLICDSNSAYKVCLKSTNQIKLCPYNDLDLKSSIGSDGYPQQFSKTSSKDNFKLSVNLLLETSYSVSFNHTGNLEKLAYLMKEIYKSKQMSNDSLNLNSYKLMFTSDIESSVQDNIQMNGKAFFQLLDSRMPDDFQKKYHIVSDQFDLQLKVFLGKKYFYYPNPSCVSYFMENEESYLDKISELHFDFLYFLIGYYFVWTICQTLANLIYIFLYKVKILTHIINNTLSDIDKSYSFISTFTMKSIYYLCFGIRMMVISEMILNFSNKVEFLKYLANNECFVFDGNPTLFSIKLKVLSLDTGLDNISYLMNTIQKTMLIELIVEFAVLSFYFINAFLIKKLTYKNSD